MYVGVYVSVECVHVCFNRAVLVIVLTCTCMHSLWLVSMIDIRQTTTPNVLAIVELYKKYAFSDNWGVPTNF